MGLVTEEPQQHEISANKRKTLKRLSEFGNLDSAPCLEFCILENRTFRKMKNAVFSDVTQCGSFRNRRFGGTHRLHHQGDKNRCATNNVSSN
jgi:hypothetical protein